MTLSRTELERIFPGRSDMAQRMRAFDWSQNPLGNPPDWPQNLKTSVRIMMTARQPMFVWWGTGLITLYNDGYGAFLHSKHPWALGQPASAVWPEIWDVVEPRVQFAMRQDEGTYDESFPLIVHRKGYPEEVYATFSYSPIADDHGGFGGILCPVTEDTERIIGERQLALLRELAANTADARTLEDACSLVVGALRTNTNDLPFALIYIIDSKRRSASLAGISGLAPGHPLAPQSVDLDTPSVWPFQKLLASPRAHPLTDLTSFSDELPDVRERYRVTKAASMFVAGSGDTGAACLLVAGLNPLVAFDARYERFLDLVAAGLSEAITNGQAYEAERKRAEALAELDRAKTAFFSNVSHEFRTPLTLILGPLEDAIAEMGEGQRPAWLDLVHRNALRMQKLVNTLLDFSRIEAGRIQACYEPVPLAELTSELASVFRSAIEKAGMRLVVDCPPLAEPVYLDRDMYEKIVLNLLSNAFKFTLKGCIEVGLRDAGAAVELSVTDTGTGIAEDQLPHIFERFHRIEGAPGRTHEGTGIGLALVQELVKLHGGSVEARSVAGQGSTFTVHIPKGKAHLPANRIGTSREPGSSALVAGPSRKEALRWLSLENDSGMPEYSTSPANGTPAPAVDGPRPVVVWADDNADMRDYVCRLLGHAYEVEAVSEGEAALAAIHRRSPDLVLADVMMPGLDGFGLLRALRGDARTRAIPVILLSARAGEESRIEGMHSGADDYLVKPFTARELLARVSAHLKISRLRAEREGEMKLRLAEREALLKEVHHRVKNNLHVISSMLEMQASRTDDFTAIGQLEDACNRVASIAQIHELLYQSAAFAGVDMKAYAGKLTAHLVTFHNMQDRISTAVEGESVRLDLDRAVPCGLILNELISNTCKHAFPNGARGHLMVRLAQEHSQIRLTVHDSGIGLAAGSDLALSDSLGLTIVKLLAGQLGGSMILGPGDGTSVEVRFPASK